MFLTWFYFTGLFSSNDYGPWPCWNAGSNVLDKLKIIKPTQIEPVKKSNTHTFAEKETQAESIQYYNIENASETSGQGSHDWFQNDGQPSLWNPLEDAVAALEYHGLSEPSGFLELLDTSEPLPLPKIKLRRSRHGLMSEVHFSASELGEDDSRKSREQDVIDLCDASRTLGTLQERHRPKTFEGEWSNGKHSRK